MLVREGASVPLLPSHGARSEVDTVQHAICNTSVAHLYKCPLRADAFTEEPQDQILSVLRTMKKTRERETMQVKKLGKHGFYYTTGGPQRFYSRGGSHVYEASTMLWRVYSAYTVEWARNFTRP